MSKQGQLDQTPLKFTRKLNQLPYDYINYLSIQECEWELNYEDKLYHITIIQTNKIQVSNSRIQDTRTHT